MSDQPTVQPEPTPEVAASPAQDAPATPPEAAPLTEAQLKAVEDIIAKNSQDVLERAQNNAKSLVGRTNKAVQEVRQETQNLVKQMSDMGQPLSEAQAQQLEQVRVNEALERAQSEEQAALGQDAAPSDQSADAAQLHPVMTEVQQLEADVGVKLEGTDPEADLLAGPYAQASPENYKEQYAKALRLKQERTGQSPPEPGAPPSTRMPAGASGSSGAANPLENNMDVASHYNEWLNKPKLGVL